MLAYIAQVLVIERGIRVCRLLCEAQNVADPREHLETLVLRGA